MSVLYRLLHPQVPVTLGGGEAVMAGTTSLGLDIRVLSERQQNYRGEASMHFGRSRAGPGISKY